MICFIRSCRLVCLLVSSSNTKVAYVQICGNIYPSSGCRLESKRIYSGIVFVFILNNIQNTDLHDKVHQALIFLRKCQIYFNMFATNTQNISNTYKISTMTSNQMFKINRSWNIFHKSPFFINKYTCHMVEYKMFNICSICIVFVLK